MADVSNLTEAQILDGLIVGVPKGITSQHHRNLVKSMLRRLVESGGAELSIGAIADGELFTRSGTTVLGRTLAALGALIAANNLSDVADAATARANIGAGLGDLLAANNLSDLANAVTARVNLGSVQTLSEVNALIAAAGHMLGANNLSEIVSAAAARANIGAGIVDSVVAGANITVDVTDPANPVVASTGGGGGGGSAQGHHAIGRLYGNYSISAGISATLGSNRLYALPIVLDTDRTYDAVYIIQHGTPHVNLRYRLGLYAADANGGDPGTRLAESAQIDPTSAGELITGTLGTPHKPVDSFAWMAFQVEFQTAVIRRGFNTYAEHTQIGSEDFTNGLLGDFVRKDASISTGASLPDPFGALSVITDGINMPAMYVSASL